jgi:hypothetical protein
MNQPELQQEAADAASWMQEETPTTVDVAQLDTMVANYRQSRLAYEEAKATSNELYHKLEEAEAIVLNALQSLGKSKYFVDGIGTVSLATKSSFATPKTIAEKDALFDYIRKAHGEDVLMNFLSIHSASLNSFANKELEGNPFLQIPGLQTPTVTTELRFRKD